LAIIVISFSAFISIAAAQDNSTDQAQNGAETPEDAGSQYGGIQGIWKAYLDEEVTMSVSQSTQSLFGLAKYEGENPWNAALSGFADEDMVFISLAAMDGDAVASISIRANLVNESMKGFFVRSDNSGKASRGEFSAILINPDTSGYAPAVVASKTVEPAAPDQKETATVDQTNDTKSDAVQKAPAIAATSSSDRFKDVTKLAKGINPDILPRMASL
jgi:hypothetical protein